MFLSLIFFILFVSLACGSSTSSSHPPTATAFEYNNPPVLIPEKIPGYVELDCSDAFSPEGYTGQFCYWIDVSSNAFGAVYYNGFDIKAVATFVTTDASSSVIKKAAYFSADIGDIAGWNKFDTIECADRLSEMHDGDSESCGNITVTPFITSDGSYMVVFFAED